MKRKILSALLALVLSVSLLPFGAFAADSSASGTVNYGDVKSDAWYYEAVQFSVQHGLMTGVSEANFAPDAPMTRAMLASALYCLDGSSKTDKQIKFTDVETSAQYYDAVEWAAANGIAAGYGNSLFGASDSVTRQQLAAMLQRYAKYVARNTSGSTDLTVYSDASKVADWARSAMEWAVSGGFITGKGGSVLSPDGCATRAEAAAILMRYVKSAELEKRTSDYVSQFIKGDFGTFYKDCNDQLRQSITQDKLAQIWNALTQAIGTPGKSLGNIYTKQSGYDVVVSSVECTLYNIVVRVVYGGDAKPAGVQITVEPKEAPAPQASEKWEEIPVNVGTMDLPGMLTLPKGVEKPPVVILVQGSGASDMNESLGTAPNRPFEDIAHGLAEQGVATLRYNKRTYQYPNVSAGTVTIQYETLDDASAAVKLLSNDSRVDANRIYVLGHSLGGMMAPKITADNPQIKGFISLAGSLRSLQDIMMDQNRAVVNAEASLTEQQKADQLAQVEAEIKKIKTLDDGGTGYIMGVPTNYWKSLNEIDGVAIVKSLTVPMLILQGGSDFQVYPNTDYKLWQTTLEGRSNVSFKLYNGLSHLFMPNQISANGAPDVTVYNSPNHVDSQVIADIAAWVNKR